MKRMRYAIAFLLLTTFSVAQGPTDSGAPQEPNPPATNPAVQTDQDNAAKATRIIQQGIQALGGQAYLTWRTQTSQGRSYSFHHGQANSLARFSGASNSIPIETALSSPRKETFLRFSLATRAMRSPIVVSAVSMTRMNCSPIYADATMVWMLSSGSGSTSPGLRFSTKDRRWQRRSKPIRSPS